MKEALSELLIRKTTESRKDAQFRIEQWRKALDAVKQAASLASVAESKLFLSQNSFELVTKASKECLEASHVAAVALADSAEKEKASVLRIANEALETALRIRVEKVLAAQREKGQAIISSRDMLRNAESRSSGISLDDPTWVTWFFGVLLHLSITFIVAAFFPPDVHSGKNYQLNYFFALFMGLWSLGGWFPSAYFLLWLKYIFRKANAEKDIAASRQYADSFPSSEKAAELERSIVDATSSKLQVESAIKFLREFCQTQRSI